MGVRAGRHILRRGVVGAGLLAALVGAGAGAGAPLVRASDGPSPFAAGCDGVPAHGQGQGTNYVNSEVEPRVAVNPKNPSHAVGVWQQDRWSNGGARGLVAATTRDGVRWSRSFAAFTRCSGGTAANGGDYPRASDPWVDFAPNGDVYQVSLSVNLADVTTAILVSRSRDGGTTWEDPIAVRRDTGDAFNDKESLTADPTDPAGRRVYVVWDRLEGAALPLQEISPLPLLPVKGPTWLARTIDGGVTWEAARPIYDPGPGRQTIGNQIVVLPDGTVLNGFAVGSGAAKRAAGEGGEPGEGAPVEPRDGGPADPSPEPHAKPPVGFAVAVIRSTDHGVTWSPAVTVADIRTPENSARLRAGQVLPGFAVDPRSGTVAAVWLDGRFDPSRRAGVALSLSTDAGRTWTPPRRVNQTPPDASAVLPSVAYAPDGTLGVSYYDFRNRPVGSTALTTDVWLATCAVDCGGAGPWRETHLAGPFDTARAPDSRGPFLGDYQGLVGVGPGRFLAFFVTADPGSADDPTNVFSIEAP
jgi:hypothetical protein